MIERISDEGYEVIENGDRYGVAIEDIEEIVTDISLNLKAGDEIVQIRVNVHKPLLEQITSHLADGKDVLTEIRCFAHMIEIKPEETLTTVGKIHENDTILCSYPNGLGGPIWIFNKAQTHADLVYHSDTLVECKTSSFRTAFCNTPLPTSGIYEITIKLVTKLN